MRTIAIVVIADKMDSEEARDIQMGYGKNNIRVGRFLVQYVPSKIYPEYLEVYLGYILRIFN